jgi:thiol-disulfide isomerase/thioredoxin
MSLENISNLDDSNWKNIVEQGEKPVVVMFSSPSCPYCKQMEPYFNEYGEEYKDRIIFAKVDITKSPTIATRYGVMGTPTFKFYCKGKPVHSLVGAMYPTLIKKAVEEALEHGEDCVNNATWKAPEITGYG